MSVYLLLHPINPSRTAINNGEDRSETNSILTAFVKIQIKIQICAFVIFIFRTIEALTWKGLVKYTPVLLNHII